MSNVHRVVVLAPDGAYPFDLGIPRRVFGAADGRYEVLTCTADGRGWRSQSTSISARFCAPTQIDPSDDASSGSTNPPALPNATTFFTHTR